MGAWIALLAAAETKVFHDALIKAVQRRLRQGVDPTDQRIDDVLAGNLCRCTGYAPIAAACT